MAEPRTERYCPQCGEVTHALICRNDGFATTVRGVAAAPIELGQRMGELFAGRYRLEQLVRTNPLGAWYRATDERTRTPVEVHLLPAGLFADLSLVARFQREAPLIAAVEHPNLLRVLDHGLAPDGTLFFSHELALGPTLAELVEREGALDPRRVAAIGLSILEALDEAHDHGLLHRSLGLHNVVLQRVGADDVVKVAHTGLAKILCDDEAQPFVWPPALVGAWRTMAPEQARGRGVTGHADLYSVGAILYELLTGKPV
ncbi:MAG TPA: serine/threonine-protein kinase, partial [Myxococcota bacterium]|nr:serine/threonine-protein kinase [Myxococcota bacterium]